MPHPACHHLEHSQGRTEIDGDLYRQREEETQMTVMLTEEDAHRLLEHMDIAERALLCRLPFIMNNVIGKIPVLPSPMQHTV